MAGNIKTHYRKEHADGTSWRVREYSFNGVYHIEIRFAGTKSFTSDPLGYRDLGKAIEEVERDYQYHSRKNRR